MKLERGKCENGLVKLVFLRFCVNVYKTQSLNLPISRTNDWGDMSHPHTFILSKAVERGSVRDKQHNRFRLCLISLAPSVGGIHRFTSTVTVELF